MALADTLKTISVKTRDSEQVVSFTFEFPNDIIFGRYGKFLSDDDSFRGEISILYGSNSSTLDNCGPPDIELEKWGKIVMRRDEKDSCRVIVERTNRLGTTFRYYGVEPLQDKYCPRLYETSGAKSCYFQIVMESFEDHADVRKLFIKLWNRAMDGKRTLRYLDR